jgi:energy-coupling factor transporter ATP-binding protein EcfA2
MSHFMNVVSEIAAWSKDLPPWQSDALRRIFIQDELSTEDEEQLLSMLLGQHGVRLGDEPVPIPVPFSQVVGAATVTPSKVLLKELHSVSGVNALVPNQFVKFALDGITVIYGENGAGKSGYARVFRHACSAREKSDPILADVRSTAKTIARATFELSRDGNDVAIKWTAGSLPSDLLNEIAVFDSHCARVFLDEANDVVYMPYGLDVFPSLAKLCATLKAKVQSLQKEIPTSFSLVTEFHEATVVGKFVRSLSAKTNEADIIRLASLDDQARARLEQLKALVASFKVDSPAKKAAELRRFKGRIEQLRRLLTIVLNGMSPAKIEQLQQKHGALATATEAERLVSTEAFRDEPLNGVGSEPWRQLFNAAKAFSEQMAYPGESFPVTNDDAVCVLCQQPLSATATDRFQRFHKFVLEDASTRLRNATTEWNDALKQIRDVSIPKLEEVQTLIDELREAFPTVAQRIVTFLESSRKRQETVLLATITGEWNAITTLGEVDLNWILACESEIEQRAVEVLKADNPEERKKLEFELAELVDREKLAAFGSQIREFIQQRKKEAALNLCVKALDTGKITKFGSALMEQVVTDQLIQNIKDELTAFQIESVPISINRLGEKGVTKHKITVGNGQPPTRVLSEGEQRVVAIAAFLAEMATSPSIAPLIFDDPVSSLDHRFRERVACRLVGEGKKRQVVVFTHDIVMLLALERECNEQRVPFCPNTVRRSAAGPGEFAEAQTLPWHAAKTNDRIKQLKQLCAGFKELRQNSVEEYYRQASNVYGLLRESWERAIEEILFNDTVQRFRPSVETLRLSRVHTDPEDYAIIDREMGKCSTWLTGHDSAAAIGSPFPTPDEVLADIGHLEEFVKALRKRQEQIKKATDVVTKPPAPQIATTRSSTIIECGTPHA